MTAAKARALNRQLVLFVLMLVPIVAATGLLYWSAQREHAAAQHLLAQTALRLAEGVDAELTRTMAILRTLSVSAALERGDLKGFHQLATRVVAGDPNWENVQLIDPSGQQLVNVRLAFGEPIPPLNRPDLPIRAALTRQPVVSDVEMGVVAKRMLTAIYVPVIKDDAVAYVIAAAIEPPNWSGVLRSQLPPRMQAAVLDRASFVVTSTLKPNESSGDSRADAVAIWWGKPGALAGDFSRMSVAAGGDYYFAEQKAPFSGWKVVTVMASQDVAPLYEHRSLLLALAALGVLAYAVAVRMLFLHDR